MFKKNFQILSDQYLLHFKDYEDYLESFITPRDLYHLRSKSISRQIIELGYHTEGTLDRDTFYKCVKTIRRYLYLLNNPYSLCSESVATTDDLLKELALKEKANRHGEIYTIIFLRHCGKSQSQISGYIDYSDRLKSEDWLPYFQNKKKIVPKKSDLSYYDWKSGTSILNESPNFKPIINCKSGLIFENTHSSSLIIVDPIHTLNAIRKAVYSEIYGSCVLYDHNIETDEPE